MRSGPVFGSQLASIQIQAFPKDFRRRQGLSWVTYGQSGSVGAPRQPLYM